MSVQNNEPVKSETRYVSLEDKVEILKHLDSGVSVSSLCEKYSICPSTISEIKKCKKDIIQLHEDYKDGSIHGKILMQWYQYYKEKYGLPTSWMVREQAFVFHQELNLKTPCRYDEQWLKNFKQKHDITLQGEKQHANDIATTKDVSKDGVQVNEIQNWSNEKMERTHLSPPMAKKSGVLNNFENSVSVEELNKKYETSASPIHDFKKQQDLQLTYDCDIKFQELKSNKERAHMLKQKAFNHALLAWIRKQTRNESFLDSKSVIRQAKIYHKELKLDSACEYTESWMHKFMQHHRIRYVSILKNKLSASEAAHGSAGARGKIHQLF